MDGCGLMDWLFDSTQLTDWLNRLGIWAVPVSLLISVIIGILGIVPSVFWSGINAVAFGMVPGFWISLTGEVLGAGISYWLYRWGVARTNVKQDNWLWLQKLKRGSRLSKMVLILLARLTPVAPSGVITLLAAVAAIRFWDFLLATIIGKMPSVALETLVGHDLFTSKENYGRLLLSIVFMLVIYFILKRKFSK
jgi:uncharacterized membrane protein YdjX (TVP38/TMEM64 family)